MSSSESPPPPRASDDNVIHVAFGARPDRRAPQPPPAAASPAARAHDTDPVAGVYTRLEVGRILDVPPARLRAWERLGIARPSAEEHGARRYTFADLIAVRTARELVAQGVPVARIRRALDALRRTLPGTARLSELRIVSDGATLAVRAGSTTFDPVTGQVLLDFKVGALRDDVVRMLPRRPARHDARTAYDYYLEGCRLDGDEASRGRAEAAYRKAIELDPSLASAFTNLGTLRLVEGDRAEAEALFRRAMSLDRAQAEAPYNLGFLLLEGGRVVEAVELLAHAIEVDPEFADAHFNLAVAYESLGRATDAAPHWSAYLALEPRGPYAEVARARAREHGADDVEDDP